MLKCIRTVQWLSLFLLATFNSAWAAGGGGAAAIVIVADTRYLSGMQLAWASLYNESHAYFTLLTVILIPVIGLIFGVLADIVMKHIGIDLSSRELSEH
ncbi:MAG: hypothetical protein HQK77_17000 [Desulfobacterales bacterium]|nr:hypothetical protein [Desulfobacterales bacterium]